MKGHSDRIAEALRQEQAPLDDVTRARIERRLVEAWEVRRASRRRSTEERAPAAPVPRMWAASMAAFVFVALLVVLFEVVSDRRVSAPDSVQMAHFELRISDAAVQTGVVGAGQTLETGKFGSIDVTASGSRVLIYPDSRVHFERISSDDVRLTLIVGKVEVTFNPIRPGEQSIAVDTRVASVRAVGTRFSVEVDRRGDTSIDVTEGVVSVTSSGSREARTLAAGERVRIGSDGREKSAPALVVRADPTAMIVDEPLLASAIDGQPPSADLLAPQSVALVQPNASTQPDIEPGSGSAPIRPARRQATRVGRAAGEPERRSTPVPSSEARASADAVSAEQQGASEPAATVDGEIDPLQAARLMIQMGQYTAARDQLRRIATGTADSGVRATAYTLIAESYLAQGYFPRAADFYNEAARVAPDEPVSRNAVFSLARLLENHIKDNQAAVSAYRRYLRESPGGEYRLQALEALCRLGDTASCVEIAR